jgi:hypothetical protein
MQSLSIESRNMICVQKYAKKKIKNKNQIKIPKIQSNINKKNKTRECISQTHIGNRVLIHKRIVPLFQVLISKL